MSLSVTVTPADEVTPVLTRLRTLLDGPGMARLNGRIADRAEILTRGHILHAAKTRHKTANELGARPTNYLAGLAKLVEKSADSSKAEVVVVGDIFARAWGPVAVKPRVKKFLAIPAHKLAYGKRPAEFSDLKVVVIKSSRIGKKVLALAREPVKGSRKAIDKKLTVFFWLRTQTALPADPYLLPSIFQMEEAMEKGAEDFMRLDVRV